MNQKIKIPVLFLIFNRKEDSIKAFSSIKKYQPKKLYIAADGPRKWKKDELSKCIETRNAVLNLIDWNCEVKTLFRYENLGCADAVNGAINWFFENEDFGVIIEDDIIVSQDFFRFAAEMNYKFHSNENIMAVNSQYIGKKNLFIEDYVFTNKPNVWGWASWKRAWGKMDMQMKLFPHIKLSKYLYEYGLIQGLMLYHYYWKKDYKVINQGGSISSWATRWHFNIFANSGLVITPTVNMSINIGMNEGTHYEKNDKNLYSSLKIQKLPETIDGPDKIFTNKKIVTIEKKDFLRTRFFGLLKKFKR